MYAGLKWTKMNLEGHGKVEKAQLCQSRAAISQIDFRKVICFRLSRAVPSIHLSNTLVGCKRTYRLKINQLFKKNSNCVKNSGVPERPAHCAHTGPLVANPASSAYYARWRKRKILISYGCGFLRSVCQRVADRTYPYLHRCINTRSREIFGWSLGRSSNDQYYWKWKAP